MSLFTNHLRVYHEVANTFRTWPMSTREKTKTTRTTRGHDFERTQSDTIDTLGAEDDSGPAHPRDPSPGPHGEIDQAVRALRELLAPLAMAPASPVPVPTVPDTFDVQVAYWKDPLHRDALGIRSRHEIDTLVALAEAADDRDWIQVCQLIHDRLRVLYIAETRGWPAVAQAGATSMDREYGVSLPYPVPTSQRSHGPLDTSQRGPGRQQRGRGSRRPRPSSRGRN